MANEDIRKSVFMNRLKFKDIAKRIGITPESMTRWMSEELTDWRKELIEQTIADMVTEKKGESK